MFLPFAGLVLAVSWTGASILKRYAEERAIRVAGVSCAVCLLLLCAAGTRRRNEVWHTEASLWEDVTLKSPKNGRGLMNYGWARMSAGDFPGSLSYFQRASQYTPNYSLLEINLAIDYAAMRRDAEAEPHFQRAIQLAPGDAVGYYFYARWLRTQGRDDQAIGYLRTAIALNPAHMDARLLLLQTYADQRAWALLKPLATETVALAPHDPAALRFAQMAPPAGTTPEGLLNMSLEAYQKHDFEGCIRLAQEALKLRPDYVEAYNNIVAANNSLGRWDDAIRAGHEALRIKGDFQLARNNLQWAESQKKLQSKR
jgi:tetratricopeptide (TPR) repeat protein